MITRLEQEAAEEADAKAFCDKETSESKAKQAELTAKSDKSQVRIEKATATIAELKQQIKTLQEQMAEMDAAQAEATSLRNKEHEEYLKATKDYKDSAEAVTNRRKCQNVGYLLRSSDNLTVNDKKFQLI